MNLSLTCRSGSHYYCTDSKCECPRCHPSLTNQDETRIGVQPAAFQVRKEGVTWWVASETVRVAGRWNSQALCNHRHRTSTGALECSRTVLETRNGNRANDA